MKGLGVGGRGWGGGGGGEVWVDGRGVDGGGLKYNSAAQITSNPWPNTSNSSILTCSIFWRVRIEYQWYQQP